MTKVTPQAAAAHNAKTEIILILSQKLWQVTYSNLQEDRLLSLNESQWSLLARPDSFEPVFYCDIIVDIVDILVLCLSPAGCSHLH